MSLQPVERKPIICDYPPLFECVVCGCYGPKLERGKEQDALAERFESIGVKDSQFTCNRCEPSVTAEVALRA